jgi:hypothetical protein
MTHGSLNIILILLLCKNIIFGGSLSPNALYLHLPHSCDHLKIASLGKKMSKWIPEQHPKIIAGWLDTSRLSPLEHTSLKMVDPQLISTFVERWHLETSSFHMSFG